MLHSMCVLTIVNTNKGIMARQKYQRAEKKYFNQIWKREEPGKWKQCHLYTKNSSCNLSPGFLESVYLSISNPGELPYENFW
jgi:hypothetical protein